MNIEKLIKAAKDIEVKYKASVEHSKKLQHYATLAKKGELTGEIRQEYNAYKNQPRVSDWEDEIKAIVKALNSKQK